MERKASSFCFPSIITEMLPSLATSFSFAVRTRSGAKAVASKMEGIKNITQLVVAEMVPPTPSAIQDNCATRKKTMRTRAGCAALEGLCMAAI
jgi:hypothetical protein